MGCFNIVRAQALCPFCGAGQEWTIQFKYGDCWQYEYRVGDRLRWGGNDKGQNVGGEVRTDGSPEERCKGCGRDSVEAVVYFSGNIIKGVELVQQPLQLKDYYEKLD